MRATLAVSTLVIALKVITPSAQAERFRFVALGDMPYGEKASTYPRYEALINAINARRPAFSLHVGDFKSGNSPCSDALFAEQLAFKNKFETPLVFTPGDNEWTDCHRKDAGAFDPLERLAALRAQFFPKAQSLGKAPMPIVRQSDVMPAHAAFVENARFAKAGVHVITLHVVGSNNGLEPRDRRSTMEFFDRDAANVAWLKAGFAEATSANARAIVVALQADMFEFDFGHFGRDGHLTHSGFINIAETLIAEANAFRKPVLLIYGDSHNFRVHTPFRKRAPMLVALEVFGADQMHAVEIDVDTEDPAVFAFRPVWNPAK